VRWHLRQRRENPVSSPAAVSGHDPAARGARTGRGGVTDRSPFGRHERAVSRFNGSEAGHVVRGLVKTLGNPSVSVGASAGTAEEVRITVAWELSWYQWGVDLSDESRPVFELGKGREVGEIDAAARQWNASVVEGGRVVLLAPGRRPSGKSARR
jgi:hypothetical protein